MKNLKKLFNILPYCLLLMNMRTIIAATLEFGSSSSSPAKTIQVMKGSAPGDEFGWPARSAGDIDNDGYDDMIFGAYRKNVVYIIYGKEGPGIDLSSKTLDPQKTGFMITVSAGQELRECLVSSAGDINKDGYDDILIGAHNTNDEIGFVYVIYGGPKSRMSHLTLSSTTLDPSITGFVIKGDGYAGASMSSAGDINKDGYDDFLIGAPSKNSDQGAVYVIYGGPKSSMSNIDLDTTPLNPLTTGFMITGSVMAERFGSSLSGAGDIDKDGYDDIVIGAELSGNFIGAVYVIYGGPKSRMSNIDLDTTPLNPLTTGFKITANTRDEMLGASVRSAGDFNNDGYTDIIIGTSSQPTPSTVAYLIYGGEKSTMSNIDLDTTNLNPLTTGFAIRGNCQGGEVSSVGDFNKDGYIDVLVNTYDMDTFRGRAYVIYGGEKANRPNLYVSAALDPKTGFSISETGNDPETEFSPGFGDFNNDGYPELLLGARSANPRTGTAYIVINPNQGIQLEAEENETAAAALGTFEGTQLVGAALGFGTSLPLNFGLASKNLGNLKYMNLPVSRELQETYVAGKESSRFMRAPNSWSQKYSSKTIPGAFSRYGIQSAFLVNFWKPLVLTLIGLVIFGVFKLVEACFTKKKGAINTISRQVNITASNFALIQFYGSLDDLVFYFTLEMRSTEFETSFRIWSSAIAILLLLVGGILLALHLKVLRKYQRAKETNSSQFVSKFENISVTYKDFKDRDSFVQSFLLINIVRSVIAGLIFATLFEYPLVQISVLLALNVLMVIYLCWKRPFKEAINTVGQIFCEVALLVAHVCMFIIALSDHNGSDPIISTETLSECIVIISFVLLFGCALLLIINLAKMLIQTYLERRKSQTVVPQETSPGLDQSPDLKLSTENGLINQSQSILQADSYRKPLKIESSENENLQEVTNNSFVQNQKTIHNPLNNLEVSSSNIEDPEAINQSNLLLNNKPARSRLRELALSRIAQGSKMNGTLTNNTNEGQNQNPSLRSRMIFHPQDSATLNQDISMTNLEV